MESDDGMFCWLTCDSYELGCALTEASPNAIGFGLQAMLKLRGRIAWVHDERVVHSSARRRDPHECGRFWGWVYDGAPQTIFGFMSSSESVGRFPLFPLLLLFCCWCIFCFSIIIWWWWRGVILRTFHGMRGASLKLTIWLWCRRRAQIRSVFFFKIHPYDSLMWSRLEGCIPCAFDLHGIGC